MYCRSFHCIKRRLVAFLAPILTEGSAFVIFNGTLRGKSNHLWRLYENNKDRKDWFTQWYTLEDTKTAYWVGMGCQLTLNWLEKLIRMTANALKISKKMWIAELYLTLWRDRSTSTRPSHR
jgi:hypothetical protein